MTAKDLRYDRRTVDALGTDIAEGMKNLLARVQSGDLENDADSLYRAAARFRKRHSHE